MKKKMDFKIQADLDLIHIDTPTHRILELALTAPTAAKKKDRPPLNLALIVDRSGSMRGDKLAYCREALLHLVGLLGKNDHATLVAYDSHIDILAGSLPMTAENRTRLSGIISGLEAGSMTNLSGGWLTGCQEAAENQGEGRLSRALLLSDGLANTGIIDLEELGQHASQLHGRGVSTSTFGVGLHFDEHLLEQMSSQGGGNFYFIEHAHSIPQIFAEEFAMLASVTARDVILEVSLPPQVSAEIPGGWKHEQQNEVLRIYLGDLASGQAREAYMKLLIPPQAKADRLTLKTALRYTDEDNAAVEIKQDLTLQFASRKEVDAGVRNPAMMERFSVVEVADVANEALKLERAGEVKEAGKRMDEALLQHAQFMPAAEQQSYSNLSRRIRHGLQERDRKETKSSTYSHRQRRHRREDE
jgi:Ca-activated chloride channel homolog